MTISIRALREAHAKTTPGPWRSQRSDRDFPGMVDVLNEYSRIGAIVFREDAAFIVLAHEQVPALLDKVEALRVELSDSLATAIRVARIAGEKEAEVESLRAEVARLKEYEEMYKGLCR